MEAIGAGASVLAFVTLSLKSVKIINEIVSSVKDGKGFVEKTQKGRSKAYSPLWKSFETVAHLSIVTTTASPP